MRVVCGAALYRLRHPHESLEAVVADDCSATSVHPISVDPGRRRFA